MNVDGVAIEVNEVVTALLEYIQWICKPISMLSF